MYRKDIAVATLNVQGFGEKKNLYQSPEPFNGLTFYFVVRYLTKFLCYTNLTHLSDIEVKVTVLKN